jgi:hypothetical protein
VLFEPETHEFRAKHQNSGDTGVFHRNAETGMNSEDPEILLDDTALHVACGPPAILKGLSVKSLYSVTIPGVFSLFGFTSNCNFQLPKTAIFLKQAI